MKLFNCLLSYLVSFSHHQSVTEVKGTTFWCTTLSCLLLHFEFLWSLLSFLLISFLQVNLSTNTLRYILNHITWTWVTVITLCSENIMLFTIHNCMGTISGYLRPPTEANLLLCHYSNTFNLLGINLQVSWLFWLLIVTKSVFTEALVKTSILYHCLLIVSFVWLYFVLFCFDCMFFLF